MLLGSKVHLDLAKEWEPQRFFTGRKRVGRVLYYENGSP